MPPPSTLTSDPPLHRARRPLQIGLVLAAVAVVLRLPAFLADRHLSFDDGVYGASATAMRDGAAPFRDVFSSQGPLFLPLVRLADLVGLEARMAPRLLAVASGVAVTLAAWTIARRLVGATPAVVTGVLVASSGSVLWVTGALASDGPTIALAAWTVAVALAFRDGPSTRPAVLMGALAGAAFAVKSLFAVPAGLAVAWVLLEGRHWRALVTGSAVAGAVVVAAALPWGLSDVWDQSVAYHLEVAADRTPFANARRIVTTAWDRDLLVLAAVVLATLLAFVRAVPTLSRHLPPSWGTSPFTARTTPPRREGDGRWGGPVAPVVAWTVGVVVVLVLEHPMWRPHVSHLVAPAAILAVWSARRHLRIFVAALAVVAVGHALTVARIVAPEPYSDAEARAVALLDDLPDDAFAISDEPGLVWASGHRTPADLVDTSMLRIETERITAASVTADAADPRVCAVLVWSHRFADLDLEPRLEAAGYVERVDFRDPRVLLTRPGCDPSGRGPAAAAPARSRG
ncbi:MAG TPA: glycosyltransferase family 39 protein [Acidimicrobiia bacterium]|nr:glycosyltransferase family 39 protein [Acidimicrobiia bacterium]